MEDLQERSLYRFELESVERDKSTDFVSGIAGSSQLTFQGPNGAAITLAMPGTSLAGPVSSGAAAQSASAGNANNIDIAKVAAQRINISFDNGGVAPAGASYTASYQVPAGRVLVLDQVQYLISPLPLMTLPIETVSMSLAVNGNLVPNYNNVYGYSTDPYDCHLVVDENQLCQLIVAYPWGGTSFPSPFRMFGRLYLKSTLPGDYLTKL